MTHPDERIAPGIPNASPSTPAAAKGPSRRQRVAACAIAVFATALIVVSACFLFVPAGQDAEGDLFATTTEAASQRGSGGVAESAAAPEGEQGEDAAHEAVGENSPAASEAASSSDDSASSSSGGGAAPPPDGEGSSASDESSGGGPSDSGASQEATVTVSVTVSSSAVGGAVSGSARPTFSQGATAYDALCATGLSVNAEQTVYGVYVTAVGGLAQKEHGSTSGWMYSVNGKVPMTSCSSYVLRDGDNVQWYYVV